MNQLQEVFNKVVTHLLTQKKQCVDAKGECVYRGKSGARCAVGCLIKDEFYSEDLEHNGVHSKIVSTALAQSGIDILNDSDLYCLLGHLQEIHDAGEHCDWEEELRALAIASGLEFGGIK